MYQEFPFSVPDIRQVALLTVVAIVVWAVVLGTRIVQGTVAKRLFVVVVLSLVPAVGLIIGYAGADDARQSLTVRTQPDGTPYVAQSSELPVFTLAVLAVAFMVSLMIRRTMARRGHRLDRPVWLFVAATFVVLAANIAWYHSFFPLWALVELYTWLFLLILVLFTLGRWLLAKRRASQRP